MGIIKTDILTIGEYLQYQSLHIPHFQRPYKWSVKNVVQLLDDIQRFKGETSYRIGTIVIHQENQISNIVDGQQRTITFLLLVKSIFENKYAEITNQELKQLLNNIKEKAFSPKFTSDKSKKNIQDNFREIERRITNINEDTIHFFLNKCEITFFVIDDISEAFQFFDSQNARGKDLEPHDLLKAFHLRELNSETKAFSEKEEAALVDAWEGMDTKDLSDLFSNFLFRVRGWSKGNSSRYFLKKDTELFKGINLSKDNNYPYTQVFKLIENYLNENNQNNNEINFPFQLDQTIINGKHFFEMVTHYKNVYDQVKKTTPSFSKEAQEIINTLDSYEGRKRTGDKYVRMLFDCCLLYYIDKFGKTGISNAIEKIFIWAYSLRLTYQNLQLASVDNYVVEEFNLFKKIREAIHKEEITTIELPLIYEDFKSDKTDKLKQLFVKMKYYANTN